MCADMRSGVHLHLQTPIVQALGVVLEDSTIWPEPSKWVVHGGACTGLDCRAHHSHAAQLAHFWFKLKVVLKV